MRVVLEVQNDALNQKGLFHFKSNGIAKIEAQRLVRQKAERLGEPSMKLTWTDDVMDSVMGIHCTVHTIH